MIVGLGNPSEKYKSTRHNIGYMVVDQIANKYNCVFKRRFKFTIANFKFHQNNIFLMKPTTYMNLSGLAVKKGIKKHNIALPNLLVISDDLNLSLGRIRLRVKGSSGGQKGLKSIIENIDTETFPRLRVGIAGEKNITGVVEYVLSPFANEELNDAELAVNSAVESVLHYIDYGIASAMNKFNC